MKTGGVLPLLPAVVLLAALAVTGEVTVSGSFPTGLCPSGMVIHPTSTGESELNCLCNKIGHAATFFLTAQLRCLRYGTAVAEAPPGVEKSKHAPAAR